jgi:hypothetical protein
MRWIANYTQDILDFDSGDLLHQEVEIDKEMEIEVLRSRYAANSRP